MKKLKLSLVILLSAMAATAQAAYSTGTSPCAVTVPSYCGGFTFGLTGLYWRATSPQRDIAVSFIPDDLFDAESFFEDDFSLADFGSHHYHNINHDFEWGFKANIGYIFPCTGNDVNLTYTHFNDDHDRTVNDFVLPSLLPIVALLADPFAGPIVTASFPPTLAVQQQGVPLVSFSVPVVDLLASGEFDLVDFTHSFYAKSELKNHTWDLDFGQAINVGCNFNFRLFGGLRYSKLEHKLSTANNIGLVFETDPEASGIIVLSSPIDFGIVSSDLQSLEVGDAISNGAVVLLFADSDVATLNVDLTESALRKSHFEGLGPRVGVDLGYHFCGGFGLVGSLSTSLLVGRTRNDFNQSVTLDTSLTLPEVEQSTVVLNSIVNGGFESITPFSQTIEFSHSRPQETRVVPNIDAKLGVDYSYQFCNCSHTRLIVEAGYQVSHYFSAVDRLGWADGFSVGLDNGCHNTVDVSFDGPYVSVQVAL